MAAPATLHGTRHPAHWHSIALAVSILSIVVTSLASSASAQSVGSCDPPQASAILDANNVSARLYNNGALFWKDAAPHYNVPRTTKANALFAHAIWMGGLVDGELRMVASDYGPWELWPGPLDAAGNAPGDCGPYDRMFSVRRSDIEEFDETGKAAADLADWPFDLGAPVIDGDGNPNNYNLGGGDRPAIKGDQTIWWISNDMGNRHRWSLASPMQVEVRVTAYAYVNPLILRNTTFYQYEITNRGPRAIEDTWFGTWADPDLGDANDDYISSDSTLGLAIAYNGDNFDGGADGYGDRPPAIGFQMVGGPIARQDGIDNDHDGQVDEMGERLGMTRFLYYNSNQTEQGNPNAGDDVYHYMRGLWRDGVPMTKGGSGRGFSAERVTHMFPDNPPAFWSEENIDGSGTRNQPADRRMTGSTGPFTLEAGATETITYAIVFSQAFDRFSSYESLEHDALMIQNAFDANFEIPGPPDPPDVTAIPLDGKIILKWENGPDSNNYLDSYNVQDPFVRRTNAADSTYTLEGYTVYRYNSEEDTAGEVIATFDRDNGVRRVFDNDEIDPLTGTGITRMSADGVDSGIQHSLAIEDVTNYRTYYFGVDAYAYRSEGSPQILRSAVSRIKVEPSDPIARRGGTAIVDSTLGTTLTVENGRIVRQGLGGATLEAKVVDPLDVTGHTYRVEFFGSTLADTLQLRPVSYNVIDETTGEVRFDGVMAEQALGQVTPVAENAIQFDGLSLSMSVPKPSAYDIDGDETWAFVQVRGGDGVSPDACDEGASSRFGCAETGGNWVYGSFNGAADWIMYNSGTGPESTLPAFAPNDYEIRATEGGSYGYFNFSTGNVIWVPFETWDIGPTGLFGVNDPSDDERLIPVIFSDGGGECFFGFGEGDDPFGLGWQITDRIYAYYAKNADYAGWEAAVKPLVDAHPNHCPTSPQTDAAAEAFFDPQGNRPLQRIIFMMDPNSPYYRREFIPVGNIIRFYTTKPFIAGDRFWINTAGLEAKTDDLPTAQAALERIGIVPNPYKGVSDYELTTIHDAVRFTNLPDVATIRIYNLAGVLMTQLEKTPATTGLEWDLTNGDGNHISSGMYLVHVDVPGVGERVIKFGMVKKRR